MPSVACTPVVSAVLPVTTSLQSVWSQAVKVVVGSNKMWSDLPGEVDTDTVCILCICMKQVQHFIVTGGAVDDQLKVLQREKYD